MDGELDEAWSRAEAVTLGFSSLRFMPKSRGERVWSGEADISAKLYTGWDADAFYLAVDLIDDRPRVPHDPSAREWEGDVVVFALDRAGDGGFRLNTPEDEVVWIFWPKADQREDRRDQERDREREARNRGVKPRPGGNGMVIEMAFPWEERFNSRLRTVGRRADLIGPRPGDRFGLNLLFLDDDGSGPGHYLALAPGLRFTRRTTGFDQEVWPELWAKVELR
jgi:hypothetical protein